MSRIWNTIEYRLSDDQMKSWATQSCVTNITHHHSDFSFEIPKVLSLSILTNDGEQTIVDVSPDFDYGIIIPKIINFKFSHKYNQFIVRRKSKNNSFVGFLMDDVKKHPDLIELQNRINDEIHRLLDCQLDDIKRVLYNKLPETAKKAILDKMPEFIENGNHEYVRNWFIHEGFKNVPNDIHKMKMLGSYTRESRPDGFGHQEGGNIDIDWENHEFKLIRWSSGD